MLMGLNEEMSEEQLGMPTREAHKMDKGRCLMHPHPEIAMKDVWCLDS